MTDVQRTFVPGDDWLYYKLYGGARTADLVLQEAVTPLVAKLQGQGHIQQWFFIRYADPDTHLRLRFLLTEPQRLGAVALGLREAVQPFVAQDLVWKVQVDTYQRELERYGAEGMALAEQLFHVHSEFVLGMLTLVEDEELVVFLALTAMDTLLEAFGQDEGSKLAFARRGLEGFKREFNTDKHFSKRLDAKYRPLRSRLEVFMDRLETLEEYGPLLPLLTTFKEGALPVAARIQDKVSKGLLVIPMENLLWSYVHMMVNRTFRSRQRFYEMVCYDFYEKYMKSRVARKRHKIDP